MNTSDYKVHVQFQPERLTTRIFMYRRTGVDGQNVVLVNGDGTGSEVQAGAELPEGAGITIPIEAWDALVEYAAGQSHLGERAKVLREWMEYERGRVDSALGVRR